MKQKLSPYGNININGDRANTPAKIFNNREKDFLEEVEEGIRPVIKACIENEIDTFNSCEGHKYPDGTEDVRNFDVVISEKCKNQWYEYINNLKERHKINIYAEEYILLMPDVINKEYKNPIRFKVIILGNDEEVKRATEAIAISILNKEYPSCN